MARSKFSPANTAYIVEQVQKGRSLAAVCEELGVRLKTVEGWLTRGRREIEQLPYARFAAQIEQARLTSARASLEMDEFEAELAKAVRKGSVTALQLWWQVHSGKEPEKPDDGGDQDPFDALDQDPRGKRRPG